MNLYRKISNIVMALLIVGILLSVVAYIAVLKRPDVQDYIFENVVESRIKPSQNKFGGTNLDIVFCGTGSPLAPISVAQQCIAVFAGDDMFIFDTGARSATQANNLKLPLNRITGIYYTHYHSDHIGALGEMHLQSWVQGRKGKLNIYGGEGIREIAEGFNMAYSHDFIYRNDHHGDAIMPLKNAGIVPHIISVDNSEQPVYSSRGLTITAFVVDHDPIEPAFGYKIEYQGRSVVISGDTTADTSIKFIARDADVLIHEVLDHEMVSKIAQMQKHFGRESLGDLLIDTLDYHTSPAEAADIANYAEVPLLVLTHFVPPNLNFLTEQIFLRNITPVRPMGTELAYDGMFIRLPTSSKDEIIIENLN